MDVSIGAQLPSRTAIDTHRFRSDTTHVSLYSPRNMIFYAAGFALVIGAFALYFWLSSPVGDTGGTTLPDVYNVL